MYSKGQTLPSSIQHLVKVSARLFRCSRILRPPPGAASSSVRDRGTFSGGKKKNITGRRCKSANMHGWIWQNVLVPVSQTETCSHVCYLIRKSAAPGASRALTGSHEFATWQVGLVDLLEGERSGNVSWRTGPMRSPLSVNITESPCVCVCRTVPRRSGVFTLHDSAIVSLCC